MLLFRLSGENVKNLIRVICAALRTPRSGSMCCSTLNRTYIHPSTLAHSKAKTRNPQVCEVALQDNDQR